MSNASEPTNSPEASMKMNQSEAKANKFVTFWRKVYRPLGFKKGYNFPLCKCCHTLH